MTQRQLPLALRFPQGARFDRFVADGNEAVLAALRSFAGEAAAPGILLAGASGTGKTHLVMAVAGTVADYALLPLAELGAQAETAIGATRACPLVLIDDIDVIAGQRAAEVAMFDLFNRTRDSGGSLLITASTAVPRLGIGLPDLASRLASLSLLQLQPLGDDARRRVIHERGAARGMDVGDDVLDFLFRRYPRDLGALLDLLDRLDRETLVRKRRLTVRLVRDVIRKEGE
ncbi:MAG: DnaA regulatory inactivator Hda [Xanthomonadales bacterium]|nr:DnaA regulatory inactivator Hda [Xanthomonadales bacterium]